VEEPKPTLKRLQKRIEELLKRVKLPNYVHAPGKGRSYISNAQVHTKATVVRSLDIEKYFTSTTSRRVYWFFHKRMKCSSDVAGILTKLSTFKGHLPTGSPLSPLLSYFSHVDMWEKINKIVECENCNLTIYMDDITISGEQVSGDLVWQVKMQLYRCGLNSNKDKEKHFTDKRSREITGIILTKEGLLRAPNRQHLKIHKLRKLISLETEIEKRKNLVQRLRGLEAHVDQIREINNSSPEI